MPFEEKPKTYLPCDNLKYYRQRKQMTTRQLAEKLDIVPSTVLMYENGKHPIPYDVAIKLADVLEIEASLLYDDFSRFLSVPYHRRRHQQGQRQSQVAHPLLPGRREWTGTAVPRFIGANSYCGQAAVVWLHRQTGRGTYPGHQPRFGNQYRPDRTRPPETNSLLMRRLC